MKELDNKYDCEQFLEAEDSMFSGLTPVEHAGLLRSAVGRRYARGEMIYYADTSPQGLYCIMAGKVREYKVGYDGKENVVRLARAGSILGYQTLIAEKSYITFAQTIDIASICFVPRIAFLRHLTGNPSVAIRVMHMLANELCDTEQRLFALLSQPTAERVAGTLLLLIDTYGFESDGVTLSASLTRSEFASIASMATETVSRHFGGLRDKRIIALNGRDIQVLNRLALIKAAIGFA